MMDDHETAMQLYGSYIHTMTQHFGATHLAVSDAYIQFSRSAARSSPLHCSPSPPCGGGFTRPLETSNRRWGLPRRPWSCA
jgi:hypothetical protein